MSEPGRGEPGRDREQGGEEEYQQQRQMVKRSGKDRREQHGAKFKGFGMDVDITGSNTIIILLFVAVGGLGVLQWMMLTQTDRLATAVEASVSVSRMLVCMIGGDPTPQGRRERYEECARILGVKSQRYDDR